MIKKRSVSGNAKKRVIPLDDSDSDSDSGEATVKRVETKFKKFQNIKTSLVEYKGEANTELSKGTDPTKMDTLLQEDKEKEQSLDRKHSSEKSLEVEENDVPTESDGLYKGEKNYTSYSKPKAVGPLKTASNIKSTTTFDFQPDVCKDFKQTGYCGYGDTCKFLHLRDDIKKGWKIEKEWENVGRSKLDDKLSTIPFKCPICKNDYRNPIMTPCHHYFCQSCYLQHYKLKKKCFICGKNTGGSMVIAKDLKKMLSSNADSVE